MTHDTTRLRRAYAASGLSFLGITFERALQIKPIRISLELAISDKHQGKPAPVQPELL